MASHWSAAASATSSSCDRTRASSSGVMNFMASSWPCGGPLRKRSDRLGSAKTGGSAGEQKTQPSRAARQAPPGCRRPFRDCTPYACSPSYLALALRCLALVVVELRRLSRLTRSHNRLFPSRHGSETPHGRLFAEAGEPRGELEGRASDDPVARIKRSSCKPLSARRAIFGCKGGPVK